MMWRYPLAVLALTLGLQGCAPVVVGGAAAGAVAVADDQRTTGTIVDDEGIELKILKELADSKEMNELTHVNATSFNGVVLLTGEAATPALRARAEQVARKTNKVRQVHNEIIVAPSSSFTSRSKDAWITTKVKSKLFGDDKVAGNRIKVVTEGQIVYLLGLVPRHEADRAARIARDTEGVRRVVKLFEYTD